VSVDHAATGSSVAIEPVHVLKAVRVKSSNQYTLGQNVYLNTFQLRYCPGGAILQVDRTHGRPYGCVHRPNSVGDSRLSPRYIKSDLRESARLADFKFCSKLPDTAKYCSQNIHLWHRAGSFWVVLRPRCNMQ
jgi:hypothetical protein